MQAVEAIYQDKVVSVVESQTSRSNETKEKPAPSHPEVASQSLETVIQSLERLHLTLPVDLNAVNHLESVLIHGHFIKAIEQLQN